MTQRTVLELEDPAYVWLDLVEPTGEELAAVAERYELHSTSVGDCLDPEHLPKHEAFDRYAFVILRGWDEAADRTGATVQELTRKIAIFYGPGCLITIHRKQQLWLGALQARLAAQVLEKRTGRDGRDQLTSYLLTRLLNGVLDTYLRPLEAIEARLDQFEESVFVGAGAATGSLRQELREIHLLKRQVTLSKRLLWRTMDVIQRMTPLSGRAVTHFRDAHENAESYHFYADEMLEDAHTLLNVQLALASHRTGEVVRILTLFSAFFLPLTFIVGVYGMNFDVMPELRRPWGYPAVLALMGAVAIVIFVWFRRRGWIRG
ncbi:MAG TPA: CorA family divalent cation transporter [Gemmatimonadales bacterium]|nr:CorA family divalent cation transporter [Gemmatimonadales bacterium]